METNNEKLGGGIMTLCILTLVGFVFSLFSYITMLTESGRNSITETYNKLGLDTALIPTMSETIVSLVISILIAVSVILILMKKSIGVYGYFVVTIISIISTILFSGFSLLNLASGLLFPVLMAIFISKKRAVFGL